MSKKPSPYNHAIGAKGAWGASVILGDQATSGTVRISLAQFRSDILPHLANPNQKDVSYWLDYVKHPAAALHVINDAGEEVYVVPPLSASISTGMQKIGSMALNGRMDMMCKRVERSPRSADMEFDRTLSPLIRHTENILSNRIRLNKILAAEGYTPLPLPGVTSGYTGVDTPISGAPAVTKTPSAGYLDEFEDSNL